LRTYQFPLDLVRERPPERPVALVRPRSVSVAARWFQDNLKADVFYAVKANPSRWVIQTLIEAGVTGFDVASLAEIELVRSVSADARLAFMHPVKSRSAITRAYFDHGVRTFSLDCEEELQKILDATGGADDLNLIVRMAVSADGAAYTLSGKFGVSADQAPSLLLSTRRAVKDGLMGVSFHVGSQCMRPSAYEAAMAQVGRAITRAGVFVDIVDVGGGFPSVYPGMVPPDMSEYADAIHRGFNEMPVSETTELWCEPGRALVAESSSVLARVELRKGDALYLNDGSYGSLFDATHSRWPFPTKLVRDGERSAELKAFQFYGPTCDSIDHMPTSAKATSSRSACSAPMASRCRRASTVTASMRSPRSRTPRWPRCMVSRPAPSRPCAPRRKSRPARSFACLAPRARRASASSVGAKPSHRRSNSQRPVAPSGPLLLLTTGAQTKGKPLQ
jgi:ornithine decarboxylase